MMPAGNEQFAFFLSTSTAHKKSKWSEQYSMQAYYG
jgi:hypothetical protein